MTPSQRKAAERSRKRASGLVKLEIWAPASEHEVIKRLAREWLRTVGYVQRHEAPTLDDLIDKDA